MAEGLRLHAGTRAHRRACDRPVKAIASDLHLLRCVCVSSKNHCRSGSLAAGVAGLGWLSAGLRSTYTLLRARFTSLYSLCRRYIMLSPQSQHDRTRLGGQC